MIKQPEERINVPLGSEVNEACSSCRFSRAMAPPPLFPSAFCDDVRLFCLRMPPTLASNSDGRGFSSWAVYPPTQDRGWCGEWGPRDADVR